MPPSLAVLALLCASALALDSAIDGQSETSSALLEPHVQDSAVALIANVVYGEPSEKGIEEAATVVGFYAKYGCAWTHGIVIGGDPKVASRVRELFPAPPASQGEAGTSSNPPVSSEPTADAEPATV